MVKSRLEAALGELRKRSLANRADRPAGDRFPDPSPVCLVRMRVPVMDVRVVRVPVDQHFMAMRVRVRLIIVPGEPVLVLMMHVVAMLMSVLDGLVRVLV